MEEKKQKYAYPILQIFFVRNADVVTASPVRGEIFDPWEEWDELT